MLPKTIDYSDKFGVDLVEFNHQFYAEKFKDYQTSLETLDKFKLRVCAFVDLLDYEKNHKKNIPFS